MSSVGQALGGLVGGVIGFIVGGPTGAYYGAQIGIMAGGLLDPPKTVGPRLTDLSAQTSTYGAFIPRIYGTVSLTGNVFWLQGDKLTETKETQSGKGGPELTSYSYYATFAVGLCQGPIDGVRRIWIGGELWYDAGASGIDSIIASNEKAELFTLYLGTDTQTADPLIQADQTVADVPAYRGLAYIVFDSLPLEKYGNSLMGAQVKVEIVSNQQDAWTTSVLADADRLLGDPFAPSLGSPGSVRFTSISLERTVMWVFSSTGGQNYAEVFEVLEGGVKRRISAPFVEFPNSYTHGIGYSKLGDRTLYRHSGTTIYAIRGMQSIADDASAYSVDLGSYYSDDGCVWHEDEDGFLYVVRTDSTALDLLKVDQVYDQSGAVVASTSGGIGVRVYEIDSYGDNLYLILNEPLSGYHRVWKLLKADLSFVEEIQVPGTGSSTASLGVLRAIHVIGDDHFYILAESTVNTSQVVFFEYDNGVTTKLTPDAGVPIADTVKLVFRGINNGLFIAGRTSSAVGDKIWITGEYISAIGSVALSDIVEAECLTSNLLQSSDLDVSELTDEVRGYRVSQRGPIRGGIDPLRRAWPFDVRQHGYKIQFVRRGAASVATVAAEDLDARSAGEPPGVKVTNEREMAAMLPRQVIVKYLDAAREYDINKQEQSRT